MKELAKQAYIFGTIFVLANKLQVLGDALIRLLPLSNGFFWRVWLNSRSRRPSAKQPTTSAIPGRMPSAWRRPLNKTICNYCQRQK